MRVEADTNATRAEEAEAKVKKLDHDILTKDQEIQSLQHKLSVAEADLEKLESSLKEHKSAKEEAGQHRDTNESLTRKISLLEEELDTAEKNLRETTDKWAYSLRYRHRWRQSDTSIIRRLRQVDVKAEHFERQVTRAEQERDQWEHKFEEAQAKFLASKKELDELAGQVSSKDSRRKRYILIQSFATLSARLSLNACHAINAVCGTMLGIRKQACCNLSLVVSNTPPFCPDGRVCLLMPTSMLPTSRPLTFPPRLSLALAVSVPCLPTMTHSPQLACCLFA